MSFKVNFNNKEMVFDKPVSILSIVGNDKNIICAKINNTVRELTYIIDKNCTLETLTTKDRDAIYIYEASLRYLIAMALNEINPKIKATFNYSISRSIFLFFSNQSIKIKSSFIEVLKGKMEELIKKDLPLIRKKLDKNEVKEIFKKEGFKDKVDLLEYRPEITAHIYDCNGYKNYMYERMVPSTGYLKKYNLIYYPPGIIIQYPRSESNGEIPPFEDAPTYRKTLTTTYSWARQAGLKTIAGINKTIKEYGAVDVINMCEHHHNAQFAELGELIEKENKKIRLICVAGPSSSGKTTFANRLRIELLSRGMKPVRISIDDYYLPQDQIPRDENGKKDYEHIEALDIKRFDKDISTLIDGGEVTLPKMDFVNKKIIEGKKIKVDEDQPIIIEGIHALNNSLTPSIPRHQKFKIFIAPNAQINIDDHNPMSLTSLRLLRRIVRDNQFRNSPALETLEMWDSVRKGEFKWIYANQEDADFVFNSMLYYELCVMKKYAMPLLEKIDRDSPEFPFAERLMRMLKFFSDLPDEWVPCNSLLREFIGGSCYADV